ncbi:uncharacterized protein BP01DRAFT_359253 [Aspergillus saccharolyticus JOP 1030-1]|uniref:ER membrane protein complex subunit 7 beta-sandwich domain-containing protein n=1 Tax=Aspergillus saccharolyticus JOP 1030-1 TaxID=1450539 RepID=A0A318Z6Q7_9EURO|nr:hypothetical protein BP01DRAFT_359253 [Aspergillus saccharolyticus JOP 1030-1]PYH42789.1 hypothetical protein BP01DRAFT_359253 [Aspergillus saccharolyticus JOP 1030-1]
MHLFDGSFARLIFVLLSAPALVLSALTIIIPSSSLLPNPHALPAGTHATLTTLPSSPSSPSQLAASLTRFATFVFAKIPAQSKPQSYLLDIRSPDFIFAPYRVDVAADGSVLGIWETFRANPWDNRGPEKHVFDTATVAGHNERISAAIKSNVTVEARVLARRTFYEERPRFSPLALFKNPMILLALVALGFTFGMPKLMENMDPEMRAEFEKQSRSSPITGATRNAITGGGAPGNFDLAGWMAGATPRSAPGIERVTPGIERVTPGIERVTASGKDSGDASRRRGQA